MGAFVLHDAIVTTFHWAVPLDGNDRVRGNSRCRWHRGQNFDETRPWSHIVYCCRYFPHGSKREGFFVIRGEVSAHVYDIEGESDKARHPVANPTPGKITAVLWCGNEH